ncbi:hypothetical protein HD554DRAFT_2071105 [Boletus coccyginus]|nr:hypothetical protein HD554DRAFT_2071105 [Boletus coccyginus]
MFTVPSAAHAEVIGCEKAEKDSSELVPVSLQHPESKFFGEHAPIVDDDPTSQASTVVLKGHSSPISTLLEELLVMVFDEVITSESSSCQYRRTRAGWWLSSPRIFASVSTAWRAIVFACPRLWRHVHLTPVQSIHALKEQLRLSSPLPIHLTVHQWPLRNANSGSGPFSVVALTAQLRSILSPLDEQGTTLAPASHKIESITINATERSTFLNYILQTWTGRGSKFPALRHVTINGNACATWSRASFFDGRNAPALERLELSNVAIAYDAYRLTWGIGLNLTTLVWAAPALNHGSLVVPVPCFHHIVSSFPNLITLELHEHVVALEHATLESLEENSVAPFTHIRDLRVSGQVFSNARAAFLLFYLLPSVRHVAVRGRACSGPLGLRTVTLALQGLICLPKEFGWPAVLPNLENLGLECVENACEEWKAWCMGELELWRQWQETMAGKERVRVHIEAVPIVTDEGNVDV